eukprot:TRINITY_DN5311_c0_g1_i1.p1 TRINITY_DN5311_c0_g1~~TRINITY_DN5311_c0_g1_i1.p1  ORF type:complete len:760 (+),score=110.03 TRINITY_DN5311_c0_g1_i1:233-2512(+)
MLSSSSSSLRWAAAVVVLSLIVGSITCAPPISVVSSSSITTTSSGRTISHGGHWKTDGAVYNNTLLSALSHVYDGEVELFSSVDEAINATAEGGVLLVLADGYPVNLTRVTRGNYVSIAAKSIRYYIEYPDMFPSGTIVNDTVATASFQRPVVWGNTMLDAQRNRSSLTNMTLLNAGACQYLSTNRSISVNSSTTLMYMAWVAGFSQAPFGLAQSNPVPFLVQIGDDDGGTFSGSFGFVAMSKLSTWSTLRYAPPNNWRQVWSYILSVLLLQPNLRPFDEHSWPSAVNPSYSQTDTLPPTAHMDTFTRAAEWLQTRSELLPTRSRYLETEPILANDTQQYPFPLEPTPGGGGGDVIGNGTWGLYEGFSSVMNATGLGNQSIVLRIDCHLETAGALAWYHRLGGNGSAAVASTNLMNFVFDTSAAQGGNRANASSPEYGLLIWGLVDPSWLATYYGDDNARALLGAINAASLLNESSWNEGIVKAMLANLRTSNQLGFRQPSITVAELEENGWKYFYSNTNQTYFWPHMESYLWACWLWSYEVTGFDLFYERAYSAINKTMAAYVSPCDAAPCEWQWTNGITQERARMLLPLSWLIRINDTTQHRQWLQTIADDLLAQQHECGGIMEQMGRAGYGSASAPTSNPMYGTHEAPLEQENGDAVTDALYTMNFAFFGFHEAAIITGEEVYWNATMQIADFFARTQISSLEGYAVTHERSGRLTHDVHAAAAAMPALLQPRPQLLCRSHTYTGTPVARCMVSRV